MNLYFALKIWCVKQLQTVYARREFPAHHPSKCSVRLSSYPPSVSHAHIRTRFLSITSASWYNAVLSAMCAAQGELTSTVESKHARIWLYRSSFLFLVHKYVLSNMYALMHNHFTYHSPTGHSLCLQTPLNMHKDILQTAIKAGHVHSYLLSAALAWVPQRSAPLWCPSCLCSCESCWWSPPSSAPPSSGPLSVVSAQKQAKRSQCGRPE